MNFAEAMQRSQTGYVKYRYTLDEGLTDHAIDLHILPDGLSDVRFAIREQYADWSDMERVQKALGIDIAEMSIVPQGYSGDEPVCAFHVEKTFHGISADHAAQIAAMCHISIEKGWFPASAEEVAI